MVFVKGPEGTGGRAGFCLAKSKNAEVGYELYSGMLIS